jgi:hypothetical protein
MTTYQPLPFPIGSTLKGTDSAGNLINSHILGRVYQIESFGSVVGAAATVRRPKTVIAMRNSSGQVMLGKRVVVNKTAGGSGDLEAFDGYAATTGNANIAGVLDDQLPSTGVADKDICWVVVRGPVKVLTGNASGAANNFGVNAVLVAGTAASSRTSLAGRMDGGQTPTVQNFLGVALSSNTTAQTDREILINAKVNY